MAASKAALLKGLDRFVWIALGCLFLYRCVLPVGTGPLDVAMADVRVATAGKPLMVVFDGARCPACFAMAPVVDQLEREFKGQVEVRRYVMDRLPPDSVEHREAYDLASRVGFDRTPTFLVVDAQGRLQAKVTGATSYLTLRGAIVKAAGGS